MAYYATGSADSGTVHARIIDDAENIIRQFNTPALSASLLDKIVTCKLSSTTAPVEWSTYHKMTDIHRLQLETVFDSLHGLDSNACGGWKINNRGHNAHSEILRAILLSLTSLIFVRTSTTITMGTLGQSGKKLVANEGIASLKADCELILKLVTKLTESPSPKPEEALIRTRR